MDFSKFTTEELETMLEKHREELGKMVMMAGLEAMIQTIADIEFVLKQREDGETK